MAKLMYYYGTMNSMKSGMLLSSAYSYKATDRVPLLIANKIDDRDGYLISSRMGVAQKPDLLVSKDDNLIEVLESWFHDKGCPDVIMVDEIQFFTKNQIDSLTSIVDKWEIDITVYGLKTDFQGNLFEGSKRLMEIADSIREVKSICYFCNNKATMNLRVDEDGNGLAEGETIQVGGNESYIPTCRACFKEKLKRV